MTKCRTAQLLFRWSHTSLLFTLAPAAVACAQRARAEPAAECSALETDRRILQDKNGVQLYIEPVVLSKHPASVSVLLAGAPNYSYPVGPRGQVTGIEKNTLFGAILRDSIASVIPNPVDGQVMAVRAVPRRTAGWHVVFAQFPRDYVFPDPENVLALWHGIVEGDRFISLARVPSPPALRLQSFQSSQLISAGDSLWWAMRYVSHDSSGVALFSGITKGSSTSWSHSTARANIAFAALAHTSETGLILFATHGSEGRVLTNSLYLHRRPTLLHGSELLASGSDGSVLDLQILRDRNDLILSWTARLPSDPPTAPSILGLANPLGSAREQPFEIAKDVATSAAVQASDSLPWWVTDHRDSLGAGTLSLWKRSERGARAHGSISNPYAGPFGAIESSRDTLLISGPLLRQNDPDRPLVSLLMKVTGRCTPAF